MNKKEQIAIIQQCAEGNTIAQRKLYDEFSEMLFATCRRYMGNSHDAMDVLQDGFIRIFKYAHTFDADGGNLKGWMKTICIREALRKLKKKKKFNPLEDMMYQPSIDPSIINTLDVQALHDLIAELPEKQRTVFNLYVVEGYSHKEIAEIINVEEASSRSILSRTRNLLKSKLLKINKQEAWV